MGTTSPLISSKLLGKYEAPLIRKVADYFKNRGFEVVPHTRFNIAMSNVLSDVDILAVKNGQLYVVEVKSSRDKLERAANQLDRIRDFVDYVYVATDRVVRKWMHRNIGLLFIDSVSGNIRQLHKARLLRCSPRPSTVNEFQKKCLLRTSKVIMDQPASRRLYKSQIAQMVILNSTPIKLRSYMKNIATCSLDCKNDCPIWKFKS